MDERRYNYFQEKKKQYESKEAGRKQKLKKDVLYLMRTCYYDERGCVITTLYNVEYEHLREACAELSTDGYVLTCSEPTITTGFFTISIVCTGVRNPDCELDVFLRNHEASMEWAKSEQERIAKLNIPDIPSIRSSTRLWIDQVLDDDNRWEHNGCPVVCNSSFSDIFETEAKAYCVELSKNGYIYTCSDLRHTQDSDVYITVEKEEEMNKRLKMERSNMKGKSMPFDESVWYGPPNPVAEAAADEFVKQPWPDQEVHPDDAKVTAIRKRLGLE